MCLPEFPRAKNIILQISNWVIKLSVSTSRKTTCSSELFGTAKITFVELFSSPASFCKSSRTLNCLIMPEIETNISRLQYQIPR